MDRTLPYGGGDSSNDADNCVDHLPAGHNPVSVSFRGLTLGRMLSLRKFWFSVVFTAVLLAIIVEVSIWLFVPKTIQVFDFYFDAEAVQELR